MLKVPSGNTEITNQIFRKMTSIKSGDSTASSLSSKTGPGMIIFYVDNFLMNNPRYTFIELHYIHTQYISVSSTTYTSPSNSPSKSKESQSPSNTLETLLFKATNPSNKLEDVNTIKLFCDLVIETNANGNNEGSVTACRILAHKIQSPQVISID